MLQQSRTGHRASFFSRYVRVFVMLATLLLGVRLAVGALTVVATALLRPARGAAGGGGARVGFGRLRGLVARRQIAGVRPAPVRAQGYRRPPGRGSAVTVGLNAGAPLLARLVTKAGPVYGSFATVAGIFALLYLVGQALVYAAEVAAVRYAGLWPRAVDLTRPDHWRRMPAHWPC